jgi:hypothetical protein
MELLQSVCTILANALERNRFEARSLVTTSLVRVLANATVLSRRGTYFGSEASHPKDITAEKQLAS